MSGDTLPVITRMAKWRCRMCHYEMDACASPGTPTASLREGDIGLCYNCGTIHEYHAGAHRQMTAAEIAALDADTRAELGHLEMLRMVVRSGPREAAGHGRGRRQ